MTMGDGERAAHCRWRTVAVYWISPSSSSGGRRSFGKSAALEALSSEARSIRPQVYDSIFSGSQDGKIASLKLKTTVCLDIAGFTGTTDKMESEDLTLFNQFSPR
jgi:hypothetical protein